MKNIDFTTTGSVTSTLLFSNQIVPDVYFFFANAGQQIRLETSNAAFDTTIRVVGPDASIGLFNDDIAFPDDLNSRLVFTAANTGGYIAVVSSFAGNPGGGDYTLNFARGPAALQAVSEVSEDGERGRSRPEVEAQVTVKEGT